MKTTWQRTWQSPIIYPTFRGDVHADAVIVGGGITGITTAYLLAKAGKKVIVLEKGSLSQSSTTAYTTAFLTYEIDTDLQDLQKMFGIRWGSRVWQSGNEAIDTMEAIIREEKIDCDFMRCPQYIYANSIEQFKSIEEEAIEGKKIGFPIEMPAREKLPFRNAGYIVLPNQAKFHPLKYSAGLRKAAEKYGALFFENSEVTDIEGKDPAVVKTANGSVTAPWVLVATYKPFHKPMELFAKKGTYISYIIELSIPKNVLPEALFLDGENPYHYFRVDKGEKEDRLIIGGEDHRKEIKMNPEKIYHLLMDYAERILGNDNYSLVTRWSGGIIETVDGIPLIGSYSNEFPNRLVATGFSGNGMTYSMVAAKIFRDQVLGVVDEYSNLYDPKRSYTVANLITKGRDYFEEFMHGAARNIFRRDKKNKEESAFRMKTSKTYSG